MYLKSLHISNFRKFINQNNKIVFKKSELKQELNGEINIAPSTTLIVGKNNSGKTTIINALKILINEGGKFKSTDFNFIYLKSLLDQYKTKIQDLKNEGKDIDSLMELETPYLKFEIIVGINDDPDDLVTNLADFLKIEDLEKIEFSDENENQTKDNEKSVCENKMNHTKDLEVKIKIKVEIKETTQFFDKVKELLINSNEKNDKNSKIREFKAFLKIIDDIGLKTKYYRISNEDNNESEKSEVKDFKLSNLINLYTITANNIKTENELSKAFGKIIRYRYEELIGNAKKVEEPIESKKNKELEESFNIEDYVQKINEELTEKIENTHTKDINHAIQQLESSEKLQVYLGANLTFDKLFSDLIDVEYIEGNNLVPESQFGLGYTNLMMIIAQIIDYLEQYPENTPNSRINLISIEEPETFMHPQMQELFITNINEAISVLLKSKQKNLNSQLIITTHSSHILNSKIHNGNSFDYINYVTNVNKHAHIVNLFDENIVDNSDENKKINDLNFLKKHIKYKVSELFFSDAIIFVEGVSEEILLKYYIEKDKDLNKYYISIFNIDGAHAYIYHNLITQLKVPCLIITDLDIKREEAEKETFEEIESLTNRRTTNKTIKKYNGESDKIDNLNGTKLVDGDNLCVVHQWKVEGKYPTSFEEALILTNYENETLNKILEKMKPKIYEGIIGENKNDRDYEKIKNNSYKLQVKLKNDKSEFANRILYELLSNEQPNEIKLPQYIQDGFSWLREKLKGEGEN